jgi:putative membrane-bound dehydrogenase-like protein
MLIQSEPPAGQRSRIIRSAILVSLGAALATLGWCAIDHFRRQGPGEITPAPEAALGNAESPAVASTRTGATGNENATSSLDPFDSDEPAGADQPSLVEAASADRAKSAPTAVDPADFESAAPEPTRVETADFKSAAPAAEASDDLGLSLPAGFTVTRYADDSLAHDIFAMTIDSLGRVVVSGPGYVKILVDSDNDGKADQAIPFADGPASGAQGLCFLGRNLLCTGDAGLILYKDEDGDDRADGPPETFLKIKTGGEHNAHAVRRGPDGWWYVITGNMAEVTKGHVTEKSSPIRYPHGGVIMRLKPDLSGGEVIADCLRNAYDFDFDPQGELFTCDSDNNPDLVLPWYMPTRLFHVLPGAEHGWISESCQRPDYAFDAAPVVAETGRASPSGMVCYRHTQFPEQYRGGLFTLDWTFGRVLFVPLTKEGATYAVQKPAEFIAAKGQMGFAPTDVEVGMDGSLYVCVGGRGTHGTVYCVKYTGEAPQPAPALLTVAETDSAELKMAACLEAPQPSSSWSRARWVPLASKLGAQAFLSVALDEQQSTAARIRAVEILTDLFTGLPGTAAEILAMVKSPELRARTVWSLGARLPQGLSAVVLVQYLNDGDAAVRRRALESATRYPGDLTPLVPAIARCTNDDDRLVRLAAARLMPSLKPAQFKELADTARKLSWRAALTTSLGYIWRTPESSPENYNAYGIDIGRRVLEGKHSIELKLEAARVIQIALGDLAGDLDVSAALAGYTPNENLAPHERDLDPLRIALAKLFPTGERPLDLELARLAAMLTPANDEFLDKVLSRVTTESHPTDDIHYLLVAARLPVRPGEEQRERTARALLDLERKLSARELQKDSNWNARIGEMYAALVARDPALPARIIADPAFGRPGHVLYMTKLDEQQMAQAVAAFMKAVEVDPDYPWNNDTVFVIGFGKKAAHRALVRKQYEKFELRMACLMVLAEAPEEQDREKFAAGLDSPPIEIVATCTAALEKLPATKTDVELVALVKALRRLENDKNELALRERIVRLLERNAGQKYDFVFGPAGFRPQPASIEKWTDWVMQNCPDEAARQLGGGATDLASLKERLAAVGWEKGDVERGRKLYTARGCAQCHGAGSGLGPDLAGAAGRFSRDDLFIAIALPNRDVSPRYQTTLIELKSGKTYTGMIVYEAADGLMLRNGVNQTFRLETRDIESRRILPTSLMPEGLLKDLNDYDLADLYAYLSTLATRTAKVTDDPDDESMEIE